jgi:hypothetical protein
LLGAVLLLANLAGCGVDSDTADELTTVTDASNEVERGCG